MESKAIYEWESLGAEYRLWEDEGAPSLEQRAFDGLWHRRDTQSYAVNVELARLASEVATLRKQVEAKDKGLITLSLPRDEMQLVSETMEQLKLTYEKRLSDIGDDREDALKMLPVIEFIEQEIDAALTSSDKEVGTDG